METAIWSVLAAIAITVVLRVFPWMVRRAVEDVVDRKLTPLADDFRAHMAAEEDERHKIFLALEHIHADFARNEIEHVAIDARLKRLEK